ncbi:MAG TPA: sulfite exporter TauE/SafE family protein [Rhizomicrobium sp.]
MFQLPLWSAFADAAADPRFPYAVTIATVAGLVRGFSGFGSALIYMPLISAIYSPAIAAPTILLIDTLCGLPFALHAWPQANRREVLPVAIGGAAFVPLGVLALLYVSPLTLRWFIAVLVLLAVAALATGWRYHGKPTLLASLGVGATSGFGAGAVQIGAPPLLVFWLGGKNSAATVRANIMVYFLVQGALSFVLYLYNGLFDAQTTVLSLLFGAPFAIAMFGGAYWFHGASDVLYRRIAYGIIGFAGVASLPLFDGLR